MAHALGQTVVAEGVELPVQHAFRQYLGYDEVQGYLFSRPVPATELDAWESKRRQNRAASLMKTISAGLN